MYAGQRIDNDGTLPGHDESATIVEKGSRGVIVNVGHLENAQQSVLFLVRFEGEDRVLGPPVGCWPSELVAEVPDFEP